jgi:hypothetical protein
MPGLHPANSTLTSTNTGLADGTLYCLVMSANSSQINAYWMTCQVPEVDSTGKQLVTDSVGKLGARFEQDEDDAGSKPHKQ